MKLLISMRMVKPCYFLQCAIWKKNSTLPHTGVVGALQNVKNKNNGMKLNGRGLPELGR